MRKKIDVVNSAVFAQETYDELVYRHEHKEEFRPLRSGLTKLDQMIGGIGLDGIWLCRDSPALVRLP